MFFVHKSCFKLIKTREISTQQSSYCICFALNCLCVCVWVFFWLRQRRKMWLSLEAVMQHSCPLTVSLLLVVTPFITSGKDFIFLAPGFHSSAVALVLVINFLWLEGWSSWPQYGMMSCETNVHVRSVFLLFMYCKQPNQERNITQLPGCPVVCSSETLMLVSQVEWSVSFVETIHCIKTHKIKLLWQEISIFLVTKTMQSSLFYFIFIYKIRQVNFTVQTLQHLCLSVHVYRLLEQVSRGEGTVTKSQPKSKDGLSDSCWK